jgi:two-component system capsular synthesis sensor histidine kinase RcsC
LLVVEDHDFQRDALVAMLRRLNPKGIYSARDGLEGLALLARTHIDVIVSDVDMPSMDGLEYWSRAHT